MMQIIDNGYSAGKKNKRLLRELILSMTGDRDVNDVIAGVTNIVLSEPKYSGVVRELVTAAVAEAYAKGQKRRKVGMFIKVLTSRVTNRPPAKVEGLFLS